MAQTALCVRLPHAHWPKGRRLCRARVAEDGEVVDANYGRIIVGAGSHRRSRWPAFAGSKVLSVGSYGCNLRCPFCQNASIACAGERDVFWREIAPAELVELAASLAPEGNIGLAFTYNEPLVGLEFVRDTGRLAHERGLTNVLVSNGYVNDGPLHEVAPLIDAANIDLKGFTQSFYDLVGGDLDTVKHTIEVLAATPTCHLEVTTLVIPGLNDSDQEIAGPMARHPGSVDPLPPHALLSLPPPDRPPRHPTRNRPSPSRHGEALPEARLRWELLGKARGDESSVVFQPAHITSSGHADSDIFIKVHQMNSSQ